MVQSALLIPIPLNIRLKNEQHNPFDISSATQNKFLKTHFHFTSILIINILLLKTANTLTHSQQINLIKVLARKANTSKVQYVLYNYIYFILITQDNASIAYHYYQKQLREMPIAFHRLTFS